MPLRAIMAGAALALATAACTQADSPSAKPVASAPVTHPVSGLPVVPLQITHAGKAIDFNVEYTNTPRSQQKGLMFRTELGPDEGMIFPNEIMNPGQPPEPRSFWMKNTVIPLDLIFIAPDSTILNIAADAVPYSTDQILSDGPVIAVLEIAGGRAAELGLQPGDKVSWDKPQAQ